MTKHFRQQLIVRGLDPRLAEVADWKASQTTCDTAILLTTIDKRHCDDGSNGDEVWAIVRHHEPITAMLRRHSQPKTPDAFGVQEVWS